MLCRELALYEPQNYSQCAATDASSSCNDESLENCECIVLQPNTAAATAEIASLGRSSHLQAVVQLTLATISLCLLGLYLSTYLLVPKRMWRYPLNVAFWIYVCDMMVAAQFVWVSAAAARYTSPANYSPNATFPITSDAGCLCDFDASHPGCTCRGGVLAFMLQAGLIGSTAFYCCLAHNLFRSVADPFTRPESRYWGYQRVAWTLTVALSIAYIIPRESDADRWNGFGYHYRYQMCWSPIRFGASHQVNNPQLLFFATIPIGLAWVAAPSLYLYSRRLLCMGTAPSSWAKSLSRERQLKQAEVILTVHTVLWFLAGIFYLPGALSSHVSPVTSCGPSPSEGSNRCYQERVESLAPVFSAILCVRGALHAFAGFYTNPDATRDARRIVWLRMASLAAFARRVVSCRPAPVAYEPTEIFGFKRPEVEDGGVEEDDISESLRIEIVSYTMRGIQLTASTAVVAGGGFGGDGFGGGRRPPLDHGAFEEVTSVTLDGSALPPPLVDVRTTPPASPHGSQRNGHGGQSGASLDSVFESISEQGGAADGIEMEEGAGGHHGAAREAGGAAATKATAVRGDAEELLERHAGGGRAAASDEYGASAASRGGGSGGGGRVTFREYAPAAFAWLRESVYGVASPDYVASMGSHDGSEAANKLVRDLCKFSEAKGGGFFFFSPDQRYMVKSMSPGEHKTLLAILPSLIEHMGRHRASTITRILGCYSITMYTQHMCFFVMENLFVNMPRMNEVYDLKGSWVDRHAGARGQKTRLDSDWPPYRRMYVSADAAEALLEQVCRDVLFLRACNIMDYSLLLGIHHVTEHRVLREDSPAGALTRRDSLACGGSPGSGKARGGGVRGSVAGGVRTPPALAAAALGGGGSGGGVGAAADADVSMYHKLQEGPRSYSAVVLEGPGLYRLGLIDLLQEWNLAKRLERWAKIVLKGRCAERKRNGMSALDPHRYAFRFVEHLGIRLLGLSAEEVREVWARNERAATLAQLQGTPSAALAGGADGVSTLQAAHRSACGGGSLDERLASDSPSRTSSVASSAKSTHKEETFEMASQRPASAT